MSKQIELTNGGFALVDDTDFEWLSQYCWRRNWGYAQGSVDGRRVHMHQLLVDCVLGLEVDHINRNRLDNRRANLRAVTHSQNLRNRAKNHFATSKFRGVCYCKWARKHWRADIRVNGKSIFLGVFETEEAAARCYDEAERKFFGVDAAVNFP